MLCPRINYGARHYHESLASCVVLRPRSHLNLVLSNNGRCRWKVGETYGLVRSLGIAFRPRLWCDDYNHHEHYLVLLLPHGLRSQDANASLYLHSSSCKFEQTQFYKRIFDFHSLRFITFVISWFANRFICNCCRPLFSWHNGKSSIHMWWSLALEVWLEWRSCNGSSSYQSFWTLLRETF